MCGRGYSHTSSTYSQEEALSCTLMNDRPRVLSPSSKRLFSIHYEPGTRSRAKVTNMIASFQEPINLQGTRDQLVLEISLQQFSEEGAGQQKENPSGS